MNLFAYVGNNPINESDIFGLTKEQIADMLLLAKETQLDLDVPNKIWVALWFPCEGCGVTNPITKNITIDDYYLGDLDCNGMKELITIIIHESIHRTRSRGEMIKHPFNHPDIYEEASRRANETNIKDKIMERPECQCKE